MHRLRKLVLCFAVLAPASPAWAALQDTPSSLAPGAFDLGFEAQFGAIGAYETEGTPVSLNIHEAIGLSNGLDLQLQEGFGLDDPHEVYLGGAIKWTVLHDRKDRPAFAMWFGGHYLIHAGFGGIDITGTVAHRFGRFDPFLGLRYNVEFGDSDVDSFMGVIGGTPIALGSKVAWFVEGGVGFLGVVKSTYISTGPRISL
jgi:hypothetical protein